MIDRILKTHLEPVARSWHRLQLWRSLAWCWAALGVAGAGCLLLSHYTYWTSVLTFPLLLVAGVGVAAWTVWRLQKSRLDYQGLARLIERENPELHTVLLTAVEQQPGSPDGELNFLQQRVVSEALAHHRRSPWGERLAAQLSAARLAHAVSLVLFLAVLFELRPNLPRAGIKWAERSNGVSVTPGDTAVERGSGLVVLAKFEGRLPAEATLVINPVNEKERRIPLMKNLADPVFGGGLPEVKGDLKYHVESSLGATREFKVTVFEYPRLDHADVKVTYPAYTSLPEKTIPNTRRVSAVEGSDLNYSFFLNKPVTKAELVAKDKSVVPLTPDPANASVFHSKITLDESRRYELVLLDDAGRTNKVPPEFVLDALKNQPAQLKLSSPHGDQRVSALEEINFQAEVSDDFGVRSYGIAYTLADGDTKTIELGASTKPGEKRQLNYVLPLESLHAQPDQLLSYYVWADDAGVDGASRRTTSDMYFAEIRPFDEIFREGQAQDPNQQDNQQQQQQNQNGGQQGNQNVRLADLEKQILTATWNLQRRQLGAKPAEQYKTDLKVVQDSQQQALDQLGGMKDNLEDPRQMAAADTAEKAMQQALKHLGEAADKNSQAPLPAAVSAEQSAYQAVLHLQSREYQVARSQGQRGQRGQQNSANQRLQRQLDQLDLRQTQNRYESQTQAQQQQQSPQQREQLQVANRLTELAQRQQDLNTRIREAQTALTEARTERQREEARQQLKRLTQEQQDLLADVDELGQRMDQPQNQQRLSDERQQLDQTRSEVQQAADALNRDAVPQALASGTRAQRELQQLQDDVRKKNSGEFAEDMRQMRDQARELAQKEEDISKQLDTMADPRQKTLGDSDERRALASRLADQKTVLTNIFDQMRQVSEQSETAEPILSKQLYDTLRQSDQDDTTKALDQTGMLVERGFVPQAGQFEQKARQNIDDLKRQVETAAQSVLGDDTEALRMARAELEQLSRQIEQEMARANGMGTNGTNTQYALNQRTGQRGGADQNQPGQGAQSEAGQPSDQQGDQTANNRGGQGGRQGQRGGRGQNGSPSDQQAQADGQGQGGQGGRGGRGQRGQNGSPTDQQNGQDQQAQADGQGQGGRGGRGGRGQRGQNGSPTDQQGGQDQQAQADGQGQGGQGGRGGRGQRGGAAQGQGQDQAANDTQQDPNADGANADGQRGGGGNRGGNRGANQGAGTRYGNGGNFVNRGGDNNYGGVNDGGVYGPLIGNDYVDWTDRLRNVQEMVDAPDLRTELGRVLDRARTVRLDYRRLGAKPDWAVVQQQIVTPLAEVRAHVNDELARRESKDALVPLDRDPVPAKFSELVRKYYEQLGKSD